jgi:hypothetical protein
MFKRVEKKRGGSKEKSSKIYTSLGQYLELANENDLLQCLCCNGPALIQPSPLKEQQKTICKKYFPRSVSILSCSSSPSQKFHFFKTTLLSLVFILIQMLLFLWILILWAVDKKEKEKNLVLREYDKRMFILYIFYSVE